MTEPMTDLLDQLREQLTPERLLLDPVNTGAGVRVAILDTGIEESLLRERFQQRGKPLKPIEGAIFTANSMEPQPYGGHHSSPHGTTVADVILTLAPEVSLYTADVFGPRGTCEVEVICRAIRWAMDVWHCKVINLSLGIAEQRLMQLNRRLMLQRVVEEAYYRDVILVAAAHNDHPVTHSYPAAFSSGLLSVDRFLFPENTRFLYRLREQVEFLAHGRAYLGPFAQEPTTSWATAHLTGIVTRLLTRHPDLKLFEIKTLLYWLANRGS